MQESPGNGEPGWVSRGSASVTSGKRRVFYGVGAAGGIRNPALLRSTADNRARAELAKVFEVFSASLMKDYMDSSGTQNVQQAVKKHHVYRIVQAGGEIAEAQRDIFGFAECFKAQQTPEKL